ncbi:MAG: DUF1566 domain-containing protein [Chromatiaceae bacterium]|nr:DUF1566 domain-containing protein [Chromatiaceae bacterium]
MKTPLPPLRTGQRTCHDASGNAIACVGSGQDAELKKGLLWPESRFVSSGETVNDALTGLVWSRDANLAEYPMSWQDALDWVVVQNEQGALGFQDWRLPNRRELRSLISHQTKRPALPEDHPFVNVFAGWYWTSTSAATSPAHAWYVNMDGGRMFYGGKDQSFLVWPVRGPGSGVLPKTGQARCYDSSGLVVTCRDSGQDGDFHRGAIWPKPRFGIDSDTVVDRLTGLRWTRIAAIGSGPVSWEEAFTGVQRLNAGRVCGGWRLPNINELESLVDCSCHDAALPQRHPFGSVQDVYWSSTTSLFEPDWAWALYLDKGAVGVGQKTQARFHGWAVQDCTDLD